MITKRIIPCLDVKNGRVVKGVNFEGLQDMADPVEMARYYNASGADELVFYDITASAEGRSLFTDQLRRLNSKERSVLRLLHPDLSLHITMLRTNAKSEIKPLPIRKPADLFPQHP